MISIKNLHWEKCPIEKNWVRYPIYVTCEDYKYHIRATVAVDYNIGVYIINVSIQDRTEIVNLPLSCYDLTSILVAAHEYIECLYTDLVHDNIRLSF